MDYHTQGCSVYLCFKVYAEKSRLFKSLNVDMVSSLYALAGLLLWRIWKIKGDYIYTYHNDSSAGWPG